MYLSRLANPHIRWCMPGRSQVSTYPQRTEPLPYFAQQLTAAPTAAHHQLLLAVVCSCTSTILEARNTNRRYMQQREGDVYPCCVPDLQWPYSKHQHDCSLPFFRSKQSFRTKPIDSFRDGVFHAFFPFFYVCMYVGCPRGKSMMTNPANN